MLRKLLRATLLMLTVASPAHAATHGPFGLGISLIDPTGISANYYHEKQKSFAAALGWGDDYLRLNLDHLWYRRDIIVIDRIPIDLYFGVGARYYQHEKRNNDDESEIGIRFPVGVAYIFRKVPIQLFGELGPALVIVDESAFIIDIAIGGRYYF
ncbi:hypothetical protein [Oligoflexus tunisiensis]|uniref:hypothetical protein n=1 Tax=Oligoflexus tunisiensis TaxID=708132 RepID=UPI00114CAFA5|nr:hypothetical protein [Oligoflexus tunisiensis]